jgi:ribosomal protein L7/L12
VLDLIKREGKIAAIKFCREHTSMDLNAAKDTVEALATECVTADSDAEKSRGEKERIEGPGQSPSP